VIKIEVMVLWVVTQCSDVVGHQCFGGLYSLHLHTEDGGNMALRNIEILLHHYTVS